MKNIAVICVSHKGLSVQTCSLLVQLERLGARVSVQQGTADLAGARNAALNSMAELDSEVTMCIDDDIVAGGADVAAVCEIPEGYAAQSGLYVRQDGQNNAWQRPNGRWHTGLGFLALRTAILRGMRDSLPMYTRNGQQLAVYAQCGPGPKGNWRIDDESLCDNLEPYGGVALHPNVKVGHLKPMVLWPESD